MDNENELVQLTIRLPVKDKEKLDGLAKSGGCSTAEAARQAIGGNLIQYFDGVQYVDKEQGEVIQAWLGSLYTEISRVRLELKHIGVNYNQEIRLQNLQSKANTKGFGQFDVKGLLNEWDQTAKGECKSFSPDAINEQIDRFERAVEDFTDAMYTRISHTKNGRAAIKYARGDGKGHNGHAKRNLLIGCVGMLPDEMIPFEEQMAEDWARASAKNKNQVRRIVASFSENEIDPHDDDLAYLALEISQEFVEEAYPNRKAAIFIQNDGKGGKLHAHILVSNVDSLEYKGCTDEQTKFEYVMNRFNRVARRHIKLDFGKKAAEKISQNERRIREENEEAAENGGAAAYIWKDDLRERIRIAMENANSEDDFLDALEDEGVEARYGNSKRYGAYISYELVDLPDDMEVTGRKYKARSYTLGADYGPEALREKLREKAEKRVQLAEPHSTADRPQESVFFTAPAPAKKSIPVQTVVEKINAVISGPRQNPSPETPTPTQPVNAPTTTLKEAEGEDSTPEEEQPTQSKTAPQAGKYIERLLEMQRAEAERDARKRLESQLEVTDYGPWR